MKRMVIKNGVKLVSDEECQSLFEFEVFSICEFVVILVKMFMEIQQLDGMFHKRKFMLLIAMVH